MADARPTELLVNGENVNGEGGKKKILNKVEKLIKTGKQRLTPDFSSIQLGLSSRSSADVFNEDGELVSRGSFRGKVKQYISDKKESIKGMHHPFSASTFAPQGNSNDPSSLAGTNDSNCDPNCDPNFNGNSSSNLNSNSNFNSNSNSNSNFNSNTKQVSPSFHFDKHHEETCKKGLRHRWSGKSQQTQNQSQSQNQTQNQNQDAQAHAKKRHRSRSLSFSSRMLFLVLFLVIALQSGLIALLLLDAGSFYALLQVPLPKGAEFANSANSLPCPGVYVRRRTQQSFVDLADRFQHTTAQVGVIMHKLQTDMQKWYLSAKSTVQAYVSGK